MTAKAKTKTDKKPKQENSGKDEQLTRELADSSPASDPPSVTQPSIKSGASNVSLPAINDVETALLP